MADPQEVHMSENKPEPVIEQDSGSSDRQSNTDDNTAQADSPGTQANSNPRSPEVVEERPVDDSGNDATEHTTTAESSLPSEAPAEPAPSEDVNSAGTADNDSASAAMIANDVEEMDAEDERAWEEVTEAHPQESAPTVAESVVTQMPKSRLPVRHAYYFIQVFDIESQALQTVGTFFSRMEEDIKSALQQHLQWPDNKDFLMWKLVDGITVTAIVPGDTFDDNFVPDGSCLIVREKLSREK